MTALAPTHTFRALWPITGDSARVDDVPELIAQAADEVAVIAIRTHALIVDTGRWRVARSRSIPGSGGITPWVLVYEAPAVEATRRPYWADLP